MDVTVSDVYNWQRPELEHRCSEWQLSADGWRIEEAIDCIW